MTQYVLAESRPTSASSIGEMVDPYAAERRALEVEQGSGARQTSDAVSHWRSEMDRYLSRMQDFNAEDPMTIFQELASYAARMAEIRTQIARSDNRRWQSFRKNEVEPFLEDLERAYRYHSRALSVREQEIRMSGGQF